MSSPHKRINRFRKSFLVLSDTLVYAILSRDAAEIRAVNQSFDASLTTKGTKYSMTCSLIIDTTTFSVDLTAYDTEMNFLIVEY